MIEVVAEGVVEHLTVQIVRNEGEGQITILLSEGDGMGGVSEYVLDILVHEATGPVDIVIPGNQARELIVRGI